MRPEIGAGLLLTEKHCKFTEIFSKTPPVPPRSIRLLMSISVSFENLHTQLGKKDALTSLAPVYILHGEEGFFTDEIVRLFENVMPEADREFNQQVIYFPQSSSDVILDAARRFPMMADRQVVIVKEAQSVRPDQLDKLSDYILNPNPTTVLVIASRGLKIKGARLQAALRKSQHAVIMPSDKVPEWKLQDTVRNHINARGVNVQPKALSMLADFIGADLSRMYNEVDKLLGILGPGATVTPEAVEQHVGISKSFNAFELVDALAAKDLGRCRRITAYFRSNPKAVATVQITSAIFAFFSDLCVTYFIKDKSERSLMQALGLKSAYPLKRLNLARSQYNAYQCIEVIRAIRTFDGATKGIGSRRDQYDLLDELVFRIITAPGNLFPKY